MEMKKLVLMGTVLFCASIGINAQKCNMYFPSREGSESEMTSYNAKDKIEGVTKTVILKKETGANGVSLLFESVYSDNSGQEKGKGQYKVRCHNGVFYFDMESMMPQQNGDQASMEVKSDELEFPANPQIGQTLKDAKMTMVMKSGNVTVMEMSMSITNRKVESYEEITTPAGTFNCYKVTYNVRTHAMFDVEVKAIQWVAEDVGVVKTENYDNKGKKVNYSLLTAFRP